MPEDKKKWTHLYTLILVLILAAIIAIAELEINRRATWIINLVLLLVFAVVAGKGVTGYWLGIIIDDRSKISLSRLQMLTWTIIVASGFLSAALFNLNLEGPGNPDPLDITIPQQLLWLMGISTTSLVGSPLVNSTKKAAGKIHDNTSPKDADWQDIFMGEEKGNEKTIDLAKVQMFFITVVVVLAYAVTMGNELSGTSAITTLPPLDGGIVGLLGISHAGYLTSKGVPKDKGNGTTTTDTTTTDTTTTGKNTGGGGKNAG